MGGGGVTPLWTDTEAAGQRQKQGGGGEPPPWDGAPFRTPCAGAGLFPPQISRRTLWHLVRHRLPDSLCTLRMRGAPRSGGKQRLLSPALLAALRKRCPQLHRLCLTETDLRHVPYESMPASVTTLELSLCDIPDAWFCVSPSVPPPQNRLKTLSLCGTYRITDRGIQAAAPHLEELERLTLRHCIIGDAAMVFIGRHMKQLRYLEISNAYFLTNRGLVAIVTLEHLETLCLDLYDLVSLDLQVRLVMRIPEHLVPRARHPFCPQALLRLPLGFAATS
uniref:F-box and leucine rich repeat protein 12 n=1 Tax=Ficedula albicollis TaxID=59894 RepID=A0A803W992_FICAL